MDEENELMIRVIHFHAQTECNQIQEGTTGTTVLEVLWNLADVYMFFFLKISLMLILLIPAM